MSLQFSKFEVPEWYDPNKNLIIDLDWNTSDVFEAWNVITSERIPCVVGSNSLRLHATETKWGDKVIFGKDGLDEENHLLLDPTSKYHYYKISRIARFGRSLQLYDKVDWEYSSFIWIIIKEDEDHRMVKVTNGFDYRWFDKDELTLIESLSPPKTIKEQISCALNKIARTKIITAISGLFAGLNR